MGIRKVIVERTRKNFIKLCTDADVPRMATENYPDHVNVIRDFRYIDDDDIFHRFDIYFPDGVSFENQEKKRLILDIHGGGFVYGVKEINMCFNMHVAKRTGIPVASVNYTLFPTGSIIKMVGEVVTAMAYLKETYGVEEFTLMGDSAGAFLAFCTWGVLTDKDIRHEFMCFKKLKVDITGIILICPAVTDSQRFISGLEEVYFEGDDKNHIPKYAKDLKNLLIKSKYPPPKTLLITSDKDSMHEDTVGLYEAMKEAGVDVRFFDGVTKEGGHDLFHVYVVGHPDWEESEKPLHMIEELVVQ